MYSCCYENFVICVRIKFLLPLLLIYILFFLFQSGADREEKEKVEGRVLQNASRNLSEDFISSFQVKSWYWSLSIKTLYKVFISSLCIKSLYQVFVSSLRIKSKWWNKHCSVTMLRSSRCFVILLLCFSLGVKKYLF